jgi:hypothetical protein
MAGLDPAISVTPHQIARSSPAMTPIGVIGHERILLQISSGRFLMLRPKNTSLART